MAKIELSDAEVYEKNNLSVKVTSEGIPPVLTGSEFIATYDIPVDSVPNSILQIPPLTTLCPVAWALGADVVVPTIDETFLKALKEVKRVYQEMYPDLSWDGNVRANNVEKTTLTHSERPPIALFTGGIDSLVTYVRHAHENPHLVSVLGGDVKTREQEKWKRITDVISEWVKDNDTELMTVSSNFEEILDSLLVHSYFRKDIGGSWWARIQHGPALLGLLAPLSYELNADRIYIGATHTEGHVMPWGSHPDLDTKVRWGETEVIHDGFELTRQEKIQEIAESTDEIRNTSEIISCHFLPNGKNCSRCEKCSRTIVGLEFAGLDPERFGYEVNADTFEAIQRNLESGEWDFGDDEAFMWRDLKNNAKSDFEGVHTGAEAFADWLRKQNIADFRNESGVWPSDSYKHRLVPYVRYVPDCIYRAIR